VVAYADGGGKTQTFLRPMCGRGRIARLMLRFGTWLELLGAEGMRLAEVNGQPAVFLGHDGRLVLIVSLDIAEGLVQTIRAISNPVKLRHLDARTGLPLTAWPLGSAPLPPNTGTSLAVADDERRSDVTPRGPALSGDQGHQRGRRMR
jgi:RNA polymerase sigma-70 factor (ECF subfamily)